MFKHDDILPGTFFWSAIPLACVIWVGSVGSVMGVGGVVGAVRPRIHLKKYLMTCQLSDSATAWSQTKIKVKWRKCDWVTFLPHDFTWQFLHHLQISSRQLSENDFLIHLSTSIRFLQKLKQWTLNQYLLETSLHQYCQDNEGQQTYWDHDDNIMTTHDQTTI